MGLMLLRVNRSAIKAGILGVRPEDLSTSKDAGGDGGVAFDLTVDAGECAGPETFVYVSRTDHRDASVSSTPGELSVGEIIVRVSVQDAPAFGQKVMAVVPRAMLHLFSADGRKRVDVQ